MNILLTGAGGFIGRRLAERLVQDKHNVKLVVRSKTERAHEVVVDDLSTFSGWDKILGGIDVVIHLAGRAHILNDRADNPLEAFRKINTEATISLARSAAAAGVKRFIFISSIGVNGNVSGTRPFSVHDVPCPHSPYAHSKYEAELALKTISESTGLQTVIIRPPLVHGPGAPGNFQKMVQWLERGVPLPFGAITGNRRSMVGLDNLVDLIVTCLEHPRAANETFLVSDGVDVSTADLLQRLGRGLGVDPSLLPVPVAVLRLVARMTGRSDLAQRLLDSLQVNIEHTCKTLDWKPPYSVEEGFASIGAIRKK